VLLVTDPAGEEHDWSSLAAALRESKHVVETRVAYEFPRDPLSLMPYDCVLFVNVAADAFDAMQLQAVRDAVSNLGIGFAMIGGKNSFGPGGYHRTPVEEALPVTMDITEKKVLPKGALVICLHTCEFPEGNTWGKRIAKQAISVLSTQDEAGVLAYGGGEGWVFPLTSVSKYEEVMVPAINNAMLGDMPSFAPTMKMALVALKASDAATKHMIIISDGDPSPPTPEVLADFVKEKITVSTIAIFPHGGMETQVLQSIAGATGGRYYFPQDPNILPSIFIKEAKTLKRSMIQNKTFTPLLDFPSPILKGMEGVPQLKGYVITTPKPSPAVVILKTPEQEDVEPVLATWRFGVGKTAAFTSDLSTNWGSAWVEWDKYKAFVHQFVLDISRVEMESQLYMRSSAESGAGMISVEDSSPRDSFLEVQAQVTGPNNRSERVTLKQIGPRRYQGEFPLWGMGRYQVTGVGVGDGRNERVTGGFVVPYSPEYLRFRSNHIVLEQIAARTGGRVLNGDETSEKIFIHDKRPRETTRPILDWFLILLACLLPLDVAVRRIQLDWYVIRSWLTWKRRAEADATLGALLKRKGQIEFTPGEKKVAGKTVPIVLPGARAPARGAPPKETPTELKPADTPSQPATTTERLLEMKRKWQKPQ
jgi:uncharacterized membrane protein